MHDGRFRDLNLASDIYRRSVLAAGMLAAGLMMPELIALATASAEAAEGKGVSPVSIRMVPEEVRVWGAEGTQHFMVLAKDADRLERDVTSTTHFSVSQPNKGEIDGAGKFVARGAGEVVLTAKYGGRSAKSA